MPKPETCARCGQEVRFGVRDGVETWWHREHVDHNPIFGNATVPPKPPVEEAPPDNTIIPPPEVTSTPIDLGDPRLPNGAKDRIKQARKEGWTATATYSRGPRTHSLHGTVLGISDYVQVKFRPLVDRDCPAAVASWQDGKFQFAYQLDRTTHTATRIGSPALKALIEGEDT